MSSRLVVLQHRGQHRGPYPERECSGKRLALRSRVLLACAVAVGLGAVSVGPASADHLRSADAAGDMTAITESSGSITYAPAPDHHAGDVTTVVIRHRRHAVIIQAAFGQLRRSHSNGFYGELRTASLTRHFAVSNEPDAKPSLLFVNKQYKPVCAKATFNVDFKANDLRILVPRKCLKRPHWVKMRAMSADYKEGSATFTYYVDDAFSPDPVAKGDDHPTWSARVHR